MDEKVFKAYFLGKEYPAFYIKDKSHALLAIEKLSKKDILFGIDTETMVLPQYRGDSAHALNPHLSTIRLLQLFDGENSFVFDLLFIGDNSIFIPLLSSKRFLAHNAVFDLQFFKRMGVKEMNLGCTLLLSKLLFHAVYPTDEGLSASLGAMVNTVFKENLLKEEGASDWGEPNLSFAQIEYAALDAIAVLKLGEKLAGGIFNLGLDKVYLLTKKAQHPIAELQLNGIAFDVEKHRSLLPTWRDSLYAAKNELHRITGLEKFTGHTIADYLERTVDKETLDFWPRTETGKLSTDSHTLADFSFLEVVKPFAEYQKKEKLLSTYGQALISQINAATHRIHASFNLSGARTGRLSSSRPNLQNLPRDSAIRSNFIAAPGHTLICADYSQIEIRVGAELSRDEVMLKAYRDGIDLHALTASKVSGKKLESVTKLDRQMAKALNFGLMFGLGAGKFAKYAKQSYGVEVTESEAYGAVNEWHELYAGYTEWQREQASNAADTLVCKTPMGKIRRLSEDKTYGAAMNQPVQGGAAEVMLHALCRLEDQFRGSDIKLVNTVHDEILIEVPNHSDTKAQEVWIADVKEWVVHGMTKAFLDVFPDGITRGLVGIGDGVNWGDAK